MLYDLIRNGGFSLSTIINLLARVFTIFCVLPIHEFAHAFVADKLGDNTARSRGRLTLDPLAHLDIFGVIMMIFCGFGYAKPVPINARNFKNPKAGMAISALAGPVSNLLMALVFGIFANAAYIGYAKTSSVVMNVTLLFCYYASMINVSLAIFNLIPIMPLDGSRVLNVFLPQKYYFMIMKYERYIVIGLFVLMMTGIFSRPFSALCTLVLEGIMKLASLPFGSWGKGFMSALF